MTQLVAHFCSINEDILKKIRSNLAVITLMSLTFGNRAAELREGLVCDLDEIDTSMRMSRRVH